VARSPTGARSAATDAEIVLLGRDTSSGTYEYFKEAVVGEEAEYSPAMKNLQSTQGIVDEVSKNADAIGYVGVGYIADSIKSSQSTARRLSSRPYSQATTS
jgi:phosphate transport system substrate-binding protein